MNHPDQRLSNVIDIEQESAAIDRTPLGERVADTLRGYISSGRIPEGTKITEREVSELLTVSRAPARDALKILESEGLVVVRTGGRYVTTLTEQDVYELHELRCALEALAIRLAAERSDDADLNSMAAKMRDLVNASVSGDPNEWTRADIALHRSIWRASHNTHLLRILDSVLGPIFILADRDKTHRERDVALDLAYHRELVELVSAGKADEAAAEIERHLKRSLNNSLETFRLPEKTGEPS